MKLYTRLAFFPKGKFFEFRNAGLSNFRLLKIGRLHIANGMVVIKLTDNKALFIHLH